MQIPAGKEGTACENLPKGGKAKLPVYMVRLHLDGGVFFRYTTEKQRRNLLWNGSQ